MSGLTEWTEAAPKGRRYLFYFTSGDFALSNLQNRRIKISRFDKCNDIFELASFSMKSRAVRIKHKNWLEQTQGFFGLICLSRHWRKALMWAHYGDNGKGACLVFSVPENHVTRVKYVPKRVQRGDDFEFPKPSENKNFFDFCSSKFSAWKYESEERYFCDLNSRKGIIDVKIEDETHKFLKFSSGFELIGLINGPKPDISHKQFKGSFEGPLNFFQCRAAFSGFYLTSQRKKELWI